MTRTPETYFDLGAIFRDAGDRLLAAWDRGAKGLNMVLDPATMFSTNLHGAPLAPEEQTALLIAGGAVLMLIIEALWLRLNRYRFGKKPTRKRTNR